MASSRLKNLSKMSMVSVWPSLMAMLASGRTLIVMDWVDQCTPDPASIWPSAKYAMAAAFLSVMVTVKEVL